MTTPELVLTAPVEQMHLTSKADEPKVSGTLIRPVDRHYVGAITGFYSGEKSR